MQSDQVPTTRGRIMALLRRSERTVEELAQALHITDNAVRGHLLALERDGLAQQGSLRRGRHKPASTYVLTAQAERRYPKAYAPVLGQLLAVLAEQLDPPDLEKMLRLAGHRLAAGQAAMGEDRQARVAQATNVLNQLGGLAELEEDAAGYWIRGYGCPLAEVAASRSEVCRLAGAMLTELVGVPVQEHCQHGAAVRCLFRVPRNGAGRPLLSDGGIVMSTRDAPAPPIAPPLEN